MHEFCTPATRFREACCTNGAPGLPVKRKEKEDAGIWGKFVIKGLRQVGVWIDPMRTC
jgi:hypothetical protein